MSQGSPLEHFSYDANGRLCARGRPMSEIARVCGTPTYVYDADAIRSRYHELTEAFASIGPEVRFAAKACGNLSVLRDLVGLGAGVDVVSGGEVERAWTAGCPMERVCFAGVGKTDDEIRAALDGRYSPLAAGFDGMDPVRRGPIGLFNVESADELSRIDSIARELGVTARCALRVKPLVDAKTHDYTSTGRLADKFGVDLEDAPELFARFGRVEDIAGARLIGLHAHIGSPVNTTEPFVKSARVLVDLAASLRERGRLIELINLGGGWGTAYQTGEAPDLRVYAEAVAPVLADELTRGTRILIEPGRTLVANAGVLLLSVTAVKRTGGRRFVVLDAGMNALIRPSLYGAFHFAWPIEVSASDVPRAASQDAGIPGRFEPADLVGPICESGDFLARERPFPEVRPGDVVAVLSAGAYGMSMSSNYNDHAQPAEVLLDGGRVIRARRRESIGDLLQPEAEAIELRCEVTEDE
ncbi:MAG: diaminopimelate decarboxylase [Planctomycetota bacterium]